MAGVAGIIIEKPDLSTPAGATGPITALSSWSVRREINKGGVWHVSFGVGEPMGIDIKTGWRVSLVQEGANPAITAPAYMMRRGKVEHHEYSIDESGAIILTLAGITALGALVDRGTHLGNVFTGNDLATIAGGIVPGVTFNAPASGAATPDLTLNDQTKLAALIKLAEIYRCNLRERWDDADVFDYVSQDDVPLPSQGAITLIALEAFSGALLADPTHPENLPAKNGWGLIAGPPTVTYDGKDVVSRLKPIGTDWDGKELDIGGAALPDVLYLPQTGTNPDGSTYYFLKDADSETEYGEIELQIIRSDVKNPSNSPVTLAAAKTALLAIGNGELLKRRSETISVSIALANGEDIWALPGDRFRLRYTGEANTADGRITALTIDKDFVIVARTDSGTASGVRAPVFDLAAPSINYTMPGLPNAVPIPTNENATHFNPPEPKTLEAAKKKDKEIAKPKPPTPSPAAHNTAPTRVSAIAKHIEQQAYGNGGAYQPCCADPTTDLNSPGNWPKKDGASLHWVSTGFNALAPQNCAAVALGAAVGGSDVTTALLGSVTFTHGAGNSSLDNSGPFTVSLWSVVVTGPSPSVTGADSIFWFAANGTITPGVVTFTPVTVSDEAIHPYTGKPDPFNLEANAGSASLADNKSAYWTGGDSSFLNINSGGSLSGAAIGPASASFDAIMNCSQDTSGFSPWVYFWLWQFSAIVTLA